MQVGVNVKCMHTNFGGRNHSDFGDMAISTKFPFRGMDYSPFFFFFLFFFKICMGEQKLVHILNK